MTAASGLPAPWAQMLAYYPPGTCNERCIVNICNAYMYSYTTPYPMGYENSNIEPKMVLQLQSHGKQRRRKLYVCVAEKKNVSGGMRV